MVTGAGRWASERLSKLQAHSRAESRFGQKRLGPESNSGEDRGEPEAGRSVEEGGNQTIPQQQPTEEDEEEEV